MINSSPGDIIRHDSRKSNPKYTTNLKVVQWNIERGYELDLVIQELKALDADIIALQELDLWCKRSKGVDQLKILCEALEMNGGFLIEFTELESPLRSERTQGGGFHGNAILSKYDMNFQTIDHKYQPVDWETEGAKFNEPRLGRRFTLVAEIQTPFKKTLCYSAHLEVFCGLTGRVLQFSEILEHSQRNSAEYPFQLVFGDLNTMAHSIARLSSLFCCDRYRWQSLGFSEGEWWWKYLFSWHVGDGPVNKSLAKAMPELAEYPGVLEAARNPGLYDPWDPSSDITLNNPEYLGLYKAKLDWTLLRGFNVLDKTIGNESYTASDHAYLALKIARCENLSLVEDPVKFRNHFPTPKTWISGVAKRCLLVGLTALALFTLLKAQHIFIPPPYSAL